MYELNEVAAAVEPAETAELCNCWFGRVARAAVGGQQLVAVLDDEGKDDAVVVIEGIDWFDNLKYKNFTRHKLTNSCKITNCFKLHRHSKDTATIHENASC